MEVNTTLEPKIDFSLEHFFKKTYSDYIVEKKNIFNSYISLNITEHSKFYINMLLFSFIFIVNLVLIIKRNTNKDDKKFIAFYNELYYDLLKYLIIELALFISETIEHSQFHISKSLARISIVLISLLIFHSVKGMFGLGLH
jgi:hypothetical protein